MKNIFGYIYGQRKYFKIIKIKTEIKMEIKNENKKEGVLVLMGPERGCWKRNAQRPSPSNIKSAWHN